jgi:hypothetical protein
MQQSPKIGKRGSPRSRAPTALFSALLSTLSWGLLIE